MTKAKHGGRYDGVLSLALIVVVILCLLIQPSTALPTSSIEDFNIYALNGGTNSSLNNHTIYYDLQLTNSEPNGVSYDAMNLTVYYQPNNSNRFLIANATFIPFYQRRLRADHFVGYVEARGVNWEDATMPITLRAELASTIRYQRRRRRVNTRLSYVVGADLQVNDQGNLVNKGVQLTSRAEMINMGRFQLMGILLCVLFFYSW